MFTGIINHCGNLLEVIRNGQTMQLKIQTQFDQFTSGESIAVDGICLTVTQFSENCFCCDLSEETCKITTAKYFQVGRQVNLERALRVGDSMGGHWVNGHVDHTARVEKIIHENNFCFMSFNMESHLASLSYLVKKGSVTINGVSLTINNLDTTGFDVMLIPETLAITNLAKLAVGDEVNIEIDWMSKLIVRQCQTWLSQQR